SRRPAYQARLARDALRPYSPHQHAVNQSFSHYLNHRPHCRSIRLVRNPWSLSPRLDHRASAQRLVAAAVLSAALQAQQSERPSLLVVPISASLTLFLGLLPKPTLSANSHETLPADNVLRHSKWHQANHSRPRV